ncbi:Pentatricopeptide repeat-containing protein [Quillaja saponaria]|uniref:Pentatricopeptide repeat-containing protein n=1 Tax=Quillaja saponaria TaxID=32244 RepID=A0AAD7KQ53_QUISA|nr:Pentatricopeptide repeat-containing protein [Quillaja saponaria]
MLESNVVTEWVHGFQGLNMLIHVYCRQFNNLSFAIDACRLFARKDGLPSLKTCNLLMNSLVEANEHQKSFEVFEIVCHFVTLDVYLFTTAIKAYGRGGKIDNAIRLFLKIETMSIFPNHVTYNILINALCENGRLDEAFRYKERVGKTREALKIRDDMLAKGIIPNSVILNSLFQGFCKSNQMDRAEHLLEEMLVKGFAVNPNAYYSVINWLCKKQEVVKVLKQMLEKGLVLDSKSYNTLIWGCCEEGKIEEGFKLKEEMAKQGIPPDICTYNLLIQGLSNMGKVDDDNDLLDEGRGNGLVPNIYTYGSL